MKYCTFVYQCLQTTRRIIFFIANVVLFATLIQNASAITAQEIVDNVLEVYEDIEDYAAVVQTYEADSIDASASIFDVQPPNVTFNLFFRHPDEHVVEEISNAGRGIFRIELLSTLGRLKHLEMHLHGKAFLLGTACHLIEFTDPHKPGDKAHLWVSPKGVSVEFYGRLANLDKISGDGQIGVLNTELPFPLVVQAFDWRDDPIPDVPIKFVIYQGEGTLSTTTTRTDATGRAETRLTFGTEPGEIKVGVIAASPELKTSLSFTAKCGHEDVDRDGTVNIQDLVEVAANLGETDGHPADVNGDGVVNIIDLTLVADASSKAAAAPAAHATTLENLTATEVAQWIQEAQNANLTAPVFQRGVEVLKNLLTLLVPKETVLLANYPNPFNPETWIPYQLAAPAKVTLRIHAVDGSLVRMLSLGHKPVGIYQTRTRAAYWDGKNQIGEPVASGVYFYTLTAGDFTATRKMLIHK